MQSRRPRRNRGHDGFRPVGDVAATAGSLIPRRDRGRHLRAMAAWRSAVGERVQRVTRVAEVSDEAVTVDVPDHTWGETLRRLEPTFRDRFRQGVGGDGPRRIEFRVVPEFWRPASRPVPSSSRPPTGPGATGSPCPDSTQPPGRPAPSGPFGEDDLPVTDPRLRAALRRLGNRYLARRRG